ncbi:MAG: 4Fe-4S binding protein [Planctomycetes bacterium]|nr:4Fe-4S binding protein [Planctomycetota bacterium]NOG54528.1 4Fe-4S binding protein [Planctomycetota bacterium]
MMIGRWIKIGFPYLVLSGIVALVVWSNVRSAGSDGTVTDTTGSVDRSLMPDAPIVQDVATERSGRGGYLVDPVCRMEVNAAWGFVYQSGSDQDTARKWYFCTSACRDEFAANPDAYLGERCMVCNARIDANSPTAVTATYLDRPYRLCTEEHRVAFKADPAAYFMHRMWGIPDWLYYVSIAVVLLVSFGVFELSDSIGRWFVQHMQFGGGASVIVSPTISAGSGSSLQHSAPRPATAARWDVLRALPGMLRQIAVSRVTRFGVQFAMVVFFVTIIAAGLFGNQNPAVNIAPLLTWTIWWCGLVVLIMYAGKAWCYMCPWDALAGWMERLRLWRKSEEGMGLGLKWPRRLRNIWLATFLFVGLTWIELGFGITMSPRATAYVALGMLVMTIVCVFLFDRKSFCRYGCLVGRVSGLYALFGGVEFRSRDGSICQSCKTKECIKGSETAYGCPTFEYPGGLDVNTYCIQCGECLQSCPHDNMTVRMRPWGADLAEVHKPRQDEAYLALLMLAISGFHGLTMTPVWGAMTSGIEQTIPTVLGGRSVAMLAFSLGMAGLMVAPIIVYAVLVGMSYLLSAAGAGKPTSYREYFVRYAYCVLPIALFYHLAHNLEHMLMEGPKVFALASDPFGWGWNLFGTAGWRIPPLVSLDVLWIIQVVLVGIGHVYSLWAARNISRAVFAADESRGSRLGQWPMLLGMIAFSVFSLWLLKQPMEMRTSAM